MSPAEQKELMIWGGGALAVVIVGAIWLSLSSATDEQQTTEAEQLHERYEYYYQEANQGGVPVDEARQVLARQRRDQLAEQTEAESLAVFPGKQGRVPRELVQSPFWREGYFNNPVDYDTARAMVSSINNRLRNKARSLGVPMPTMLPYEDRTAIDSGPDSAMRSLQMARMTCFAMIADLLLDGGISELRSITIAGSDGVWRDAHATYATVAVDLEFAANYGAADLILGEIEANRAGLALHQWSMAEESGDQFRIGMTASLTVPNVPGWGGTVPGIMAPDPARSRPPAGRPAGQPAGGGANAPRGTVRPTNAPRGGNPR